MSGSLRNPATTAMNKSKADYNGVYVPRDGVGVGRLAIAGKNTALKLSTSNPSKSISASFRDQHGILNDGSRASLLECIRTGYTDYGWGDEAQYETMFLPHYVLVGRSFISSDESRIQAVHYHFENGDCLVNGLQTFGIIYPDREEFLRILAAEHERHEKFSKDHQWEPRKFDPEIGERPILQYFSGVFEIAKCRSGIGTVSLTNCPSHGQGSPKGVSIDNQVTVSLEFATPTTVRQALTSLGILHSFFELCLGRRQRYLGIEAELVKEETELDDRVPRRLDVYWSYGNSRVSGETSPTRFGDVLLDAGMRKAEFERVLSGWLDSAESMGGARGRIASAFHSGSYGVDRIVGAANAFDLLPDTHVPSRMELDQLTEEAVKECRERFRALPESFARQSVLSALGRVGKPSLRDKIFRRAEIVIKADPGRFSELHLPCSQAVICRNHFVHGSEGGFNYWKEPKAHVFLADTLEFVFAASDLIELGWDYRSWIDKGTSLSHTFGAYVDSYDANLRMLKQLIEA